MRSIDTNFFPKQTLTKMKKLTATIIKTAAMLLVVIIGVYFFPADKRDDIYYFQEGKPWSYDLVTAEEDFPIYKTDGQLAAERKAVLADFAPCFVPETPLASHDKMIVSAHEMEMLRENRYRHISLVDASRHVKRIPVDSLYTPKTLYLATHSEGVPNLMYDSARTRMMREALLDQIVPTEGVVQADEKIIDRGEIVTARNAQLLKSYLRAKEEQHVSHTRIVTTRIGALMMILLIMGLFVLYLLIFRRMLWEDMKAVLLFCLLTAIMTVVTDVIPSEHPLLLFLVPYAWVLIITRVFYDSRTAVMLYATTVLIAGLSTARPYLFTVINLCIGIVASCSLKDLTQRSQLAITAGLIFVTGCVTYVCLTMATTGMIQMTEWRVFLYFAIHALLIIGVYGLIYLFEKIFRLVSNITLVELGNVSNKLMHRFAEQAPGTFQHSLQVSNLATEAAKNIGAKIFLVRTGAMYHDIGKMNNPLYYIENQGDGPNMLLQMSNYEAAQTVIRHVSDGVRLAREHNLPEVIVNFIETHHGTTLVRYFYNSEVNRLKGSDQTVNAADFRYAGPKPSTKEGAILMMADAVEARSRSMDVYTEESIRQMVDSMIAQQMQEGQYADTPLSFKDVEIIKDTFVKRLLIMYHHRIQYPTVK